MQVDTLFSKKRSVRLTLYWLICCLFFVQIGNSEEVCKFTYKGPPEDLNNTIIEVPEEYVAMSEYVYVQSWSDSNVSGAPSSIMFLIDNSGSMINDSIDKMGSRFNVTSDLVDSIYNINSKTQIGVVVFKGKLWFEKVDDPIFELCPTDPEQIYGYIPLLTLDSSYNGRTGYEILKFYLQTDTIEIFDVKWVDLKYNPDGNNMSGTNITLGFSAVKHAFESSIYPKDNHYGIFFSDGEATKPEDETLKYAYVKGENVPTTFTVYFTPSDTAFENLETMTKNIQNNGYSTSNPISDLYTIKTNYDTLMSLLMNNVIGKIITQNESSLPIKLVVNKIQSIGPWDTTGFPFSDLFPLQIYKTDFVYDISHHIVIDSVTEEGDTITIEKDTTTHVKFTVEVENGSPELPDTFKVEYWDRSLGFYFNGQNINSMNETIDETEIRFKESKIDVLYGYKDVTVTLFTTDGKKKDKETCNLTKTGSYFSYTIPVVIDSTPTPGDGKLQVNAVDNIVALFKNPKLPRDTLETSLSYSLGNVISLQNAYYFDNDAEGHIDSMFVEVAGEINSDNLKEVVKLITLPDFRGLEIDKSYLVDKGIGFAVSQDLSKDPMTYTTKDDTLIIDHTILKNGGWVLAGTVPIIDKIAPIIHWAPKSAHLIQYQDTSIMDTLFVRFSETIKKVDHKVPFHLLDSKEVNYTADLKYLDHQKDQIIFAVLKVNNGIPYMQHGDSIWIHEGDRVSDGESNHQNNPKNIRRMLHITHKLNQLTLIPKAITPFDISDITNAEAISQAIIDVFEEKNMLNSLELDKNKYNDYVGMIIQVVPLDPEKLFENFMLEGHFSIYDPLGNTVIKNKKMAFYKKNKSLVYIWNCRNHNKRIVSSGTYLAVFNVTPLLGGPKNVKEPAVVLRLFLGVKD